MRHSILTYICLFLCFFPIESTFAQKPRHSTTTYIIQSGDTFYGIARRYNVSADYLHSLNPDIDPDKIMAGYPLVVPAEGKREIVEDKRVFSPVSEIQVQQKSSFTEEEPQRKPFSYLEYKVKRKDTLYGIANAYHVTIEQIIECNPVLNADDYKIKKGTIIRIPLYRDAAGEEKPKGLSTIRLAIVLPFVGDKLENERSVEFYRGMLLGIGLLRDNKINIQVSAYNEPAPDAGIALLANQIMRENPDVIVGPLYPTHFPDITALASLETKVVVPFSSKVQAVDYRKNVFVINTPANYEIQLASETLLKLFDNQTHVIICHTKDGDKRQFCIGLHDALKENGRAVTEVASLTSAEQLTSVIQGNPEMHYLLIPDSSSDSALRNMLEKINGIQQSMPSAKISLLGYEQWISLTEGSLKKSIHAADTYIISPNYFYPHTMASTAFRNSYRRWFKTDLQDSHPRMAPLGYDFGVGFLGGMAAYGHQFATQAPLKASVASTPKLQTDMLFFQVHDAGGYVNRSMWLVHFKKDFSIDKISLK